MKKEDVLKTCYSILRNTTPLEFDCGKICNGKCCKGDEKTGMILFPGEEHLIDKNINLIENESGDKVAVCDGTCDRNKRPLSCRIYPLFPVVCEENGRRIIKVCLDFRADCPLTFPDSEYKFSRRFVKSVRRVGKYLLLNDEIAEYYCELSDMFNDYYDFLKKLEKIEKKC